jgi:hypothetical protein
MSACDPKRTLNNVVVFTIGLAIIAAVGFENEHQKNNRAVFGTATYSIQLSFPGSVSSTSGCRIAIVDPGGAVSSTQGTLLPANWVYQCTVTPGQRVSAISNDAGTFSLSITELTD